MPAEDINTTTTRRRQPRIAITFSFLCGSVGGCLESYHFRQAPYDLTLVVPVLNREAVEALAGAIENFAHLFDDGRVKQVVDL